METWLELGRFYDRKVRIFFFFLESEDFKVIFDNQTVVREASSFPGKHTIILKGELFL